MDNSSIYEELLIKTCFNKIKSIRNSWTTSHSKTYGPAAIIDICGDDYVSYKFIMEQCNKIIIESFPSLIAKLLEVYGIETRYYSIKKNNTQLYIDSNKNVWLSEYFTQSDEQTVLAFSCNDGKHNGILYVFKEFGANNRLPSSLINSILSKNDLKFHRYISFVEDKAYEENLSHNNDSTDLSRGTGVYSFKYFFDSFFDKDEYSVFKDYADKLAKMTINYLGFEIVRTLKPNTLHNFRKEVRNSLYSIDFSEIDKDRIISSDQRKIIENNIFTEHNIELLTGTSKFAQSYMTAEWLFNSLSGAGEIDMTPIVMGYYKSIEQLLFSYISLHTKEKDGANREIFVGKDKTFANSKGYAELSDSLINDDEKNKYITMSSLTGFFGFHKEPASPYQIKNTDLLSAGINTNTYQFIIDALTKVPETRNELFHKHNLTDWSEVIEARSCALQVFCLLLGSYQISNADQVALGMLNSASHNDFNKLCEYVGNRSRNHDIITKRTIFYLNAHDEPINCLIAIDDESIEYDEYGEPKYSGLYFIRPGDQEHQHPIRITENNPPAEIWEGEWDFSGNVPNFFGQSGPIKKIFEDGKFLL